MARKRSTYGIVKAAIGASAFLLTTGAAHAEMATFATFTSIDQVKNVSLVNAGEGTIGATIYSISSGAANAPGAVKVHFGFLQNGLSTSVSNIIADFMLEGSITEPAVSTVGSLLVQPVFTGTMSFKTTTAIQLTSPLYETKTFEAGANLLTVRFNGAIFGSNGGSTANFNGSTGAGDTVFFTSDFLDFSQVTKRDYATTMNAITPELLLAKNGSFDSFFASIGGSFSSDPAPILVSTVPEPASWALMLTGFMMLGAALRQGRKNGTFSATPKI
ncbi:PEPxxWA-CTERM sorting domain-containing protein [Sphingomonas sp. PvP056]|uniref:PEPxxWA-CTERM sorting domain-containing protein n=1 Tax=Sphingomonas sp. PvP056 TaxID=3156392 RepID=UPI00339642ED